MEHTDSFNYKFLLVSANEKSAREINHYFTKAGLIIMDTETGINNVIPKLRKDQTYEGLVLEASATADVPLYLGKLRQTIQGKQIPVVVLAPDTDVWLDVTRMYDSGANFVVTSPLDEDVANHICWIMDSLIRFTSQYKENLERFYKR